MIHAKITARAVRSVLLLISIILLLGCSPSEATIASIEAEIRPSIEQEIRESLEQEILDSIGPKNTVRFQATYNADYILNKNTKKFHYPSCSSVRQMDEKNKIYFEGSREEAIEEGYKPCGRCNP